MNRNIYNLVFRPDVGDYVVASEISRTKKPGLKRTAKTASRTLGGIIILCTLSLTGYGKPVWAVTDIVVDPSAPANQRPQIIYSANGTPQVNIQKPSNAGISTSQYLTFDVGSDGLIINNARQNAQTEIGGWVQANPWLAKGEAKVILSQVNSDQISRLHGYIEIAGSKADLVIANPSGIHINGGGFINTNRSILTTGTPVFNGTGGIDSFLVERGDITVDGKGLDARFSNYTDILSHAVQINAEIWADELQIIAGSNHIAYDLQEITPQANDHSPAFALDVSALGGMYANKIRMIGTSEGMGVNQQGMLYSQGEITLSAEGMLINTGTLSAEGSITLVSDHINNTSGYIGGSAIHLETGDMDNSNGSLRAETGDIVINAEKFTNDNSSLMAGGNLDARVSSMSGSGLLYAMKSIDIKSKGSFSGDFQIAAGHDVSLASGMFFNRDKSFILAGVDRDFNSIRNGSIDIESGSYFVFSGQAMTQGALSIKSLDVNLSNSQIKAGDFHINVMQSSVIDTSGSKIHVDGLFDVKSSLNRNYQLNNRGGYIEADRFNVQISALSNVDGHIVQLGNNDFFFDLGHYFGSGRVYSNNPLETNVFDNTSGVVYLGSPDSKIIAKDILNYQGFIGHHGKGAFQMTADTFYGSYGAIQSDGRLIFSAINAENKNGLIQAGDIFLNVRELENQSGKIYSQDSIVAYFREFNNDYGLMEAATGHAKIRSDIFYNGHGQLYSYSDMNLNAREFSSAGHVFSDANINIEAAERIENKGVIVSGKNINLISKNIENQSSGLLPPYS